MLTLRKYQDDCITELEQKIGNFLDSESSKTCILKSPTGSGKTIMLAELIQRIVKNNADKQETAFIWISVHNLHKQSKEKLEKYYEDLQSIECSFFYDLQDRQIQDGEVVFFNWESIENKDRIYIRDNEQEFTLSNVVNNTRDAGRKIILIIDESHRTANTENSKELIDEIKPNITINVSATPKVVTTLDHIQTVDLQHVKEEEMIKKSIRINYDLKKERADTTDELIVKTALEKRKALKEYYENEKSNVNPLVLIQIPSEIKKNEETSKKDEIMRLLKRFDKTLDNGKVAIYLSDDKINLEDITANTNEVEVVIFKQAIAVGWDCPRSSILVLFREPKSFTFTIQTVGRIMRMPELKHYENDELNHAFVYTNMPVIEITEKIAQDYITIHSSIRDDKLYNPIDLKSIYVKRIHEKTRLHIQFVSFFDRIVRNYNLLDKITLDPEKLENTIPINLDVKDIDKEQTVKSDETISMPTSRTEIEKLMNTFLWDYSSGFAPKHSSEIIQRAVYDFFKNHTKTIDFDDMDKIILDSKNQKHFIYVIEEAKRLYVKEVVEKVEEIIEPISKWNVPKNTEYTQIHGKREYKKSIMKPVYVKQEIENEDKFMDYLDEDKNNVKWWFKNGERDKKYFAIAYLNLGDGRNYGFYVDFIVFMNDGRIGLFDTKAGITAKIAKPKAEALSKYIKDNKSKNLFGGIAVFDKIWRYNDKENYEYNESNFSDWDPINLD